MALSTQRIDLGKASFEYLLETGNIPEALELRLGAIETVARHYRQDLEAAKLSSAALGAVGLALSINPLVAVLAGIGVFGYGYTVLQDFYHTKRFCPLPLLRKTTGDLLTGIGLSATGDNLEDDPLSGVIGYVEPDLAHEYELLMVAEGQLVNYLHSLPPEKRLPAYRHMLRYTKLRNHSLELPELQDVATALGGVEVKPNAGLKAQEARSKKLESVEEPSLQDNNNALSQWLTETHHQQADNTIDVPALEIDLIEEQPLPLHPDLLINQIIQIILKCLTERGASCDFLEVVDTPKFRRVLLRKAAKTKVSAVLGTSEDLFCELGSVLPNLNVHPLISMVKGGRISVDIAKSKAEWSTAYFKNYIVPGTRSFESPILLPIGIDMDGILKEIDLSADETCGLLVGGVTGGGKSMWATSSIAALICQYTPDSLRLVLSDTKKVEFRPFANIPHLFSPVATDVPSTVNCLKVVCIERERRETLFAQAKVRNLAQYNLQVAPSDRLPRIAVFIEETKTAVESKEVYTEYNDDGREITISYSERFQYYKDEIKRLARASGIYLIDSTQSPRQEVLPAGYRGQFSAFLAFRVSRPEESKIALANQYEDACKLLGKGDALYLDNMGLERVQALYLEPEEVEAIVNRVIATYGSYKPHPLVSSNLEQNDPEPEWKRLEKLLDVPYDGKKEVVEQLPSDRPTPPSESPELDPDWEAFQKIKNGRKEAVETEGGRKKIGRKSKTQLCQEIFGCSDGGRGLKAASIEYERIRDKFAHLWIRDLLDKGMSKSKIIEEIYSINVLSQDKFRKNKPEEWKQISELIDLLADELNYEPEEEVGDE